MRSSLSGCLLASLVLAAAPSAPVLAVDGAVVVKVYRAEAIFRDRDTVFGTQQDFYPRLSFVGGPSAEGPVLDGKDLADWGPDGFTLTKTVPISVRTVGVQVALFDDDNTSEDDLFDINPGAGSTIDLEFDTCTMTWTAPGIPGPQGPGVPPEIAGPSVDSAHIWFEVATADRRAFTVNDVAIAGAAPVQAVFGPTRVVAGKPLAFRVDLTSTFGADIVAPVTVTLKDNATGGERSETRTLSVPAAGATAYFFDGTGSESPYIPGRNDANPYLEYSVSVDFPESEPPDIDPKFAGCYAANNHVDGRRIPIVVTTDPYVVYQRWDWGGPGMHAPASWIGEADLTGFRDHEEMFRAASWPLAALNPRNAARSEIGQTEAILLTAPFGPASATSTLGVAGAAASVAGIDRLVLVTRPGWFAQNAAAGADVVAGAIGISLGEYGRHAVIAEDTYYGVAVHELGHTYELSRHSCSTGGLAESVMDSGCRDEYKHAAADGRIYPGLGLDLSGTIYPAGYVSTWDGLTCPPTTPGALEVCAANIMDLVPPIAFQNWIDNLATESLTSDLKPFLDPELINLTGWVHANGGLAGAGTPMVFDGGLTYSYHFDGTPDLPQPPISGSTAGSGPFSGGGPFAIRLNTGQGSFTYRFRPEFRVEGQDLEYAWFSFNVPWHPAVQQVELYVPTDVEHTDCESPPCGICEIPPCATDEDHLVFARPKSALKPIVSTIRAGLDSAPTLAGPQPEPPTIGPGHDVVLAWDPADGDSPDLRSAVLLDKAPGSGGPLGWLPVDIEIQGNTLRIAHDRLQDSPGEYIARVAVSDGVNGVTYTSPDKVFRICNYTNGGVEICNGIDDDCDGLVDETPLINDQPWLTVDTAGLSWTPRCGAPGYDAAYGKLAELLVFGDHRSAICLGSTMTATSLPFTDNPSPGAGYWFLVRVAHETWNDGTEVTDRDPALLACP